MIRCYHLITMPFPLKTSGVLVVSSVFSPYQCSVFSVTGVPHFHQRMGQKQAVSTFPTYGLHKNMVSNRGRKRKDATRNTEELAKFSSS